jgi:ribosomal protein S3
MHFQGRFTRRQRSKHYWYHQGRVPISKVMANIDFGYFVIPLVNSAVSVKI